MISNAFMVVSLAKRDFCHFHLYLYCYIDLLGEY